MPPLTWRNVDAPDLTAASRIMNDAMTNLQNGTDGMATNLQGIRDRQRRDRSAAAIPMLAGIQNGSQVDQVLGQINGQIAPQDMTPELQAQLLAQRGLTAGVDNVQSASNVRNAGNTRDQTTFDRGIARENELASLNPEIQRMRQEAYAGAYGTSNPNLSPEFRAEIPNIQPGESGGDYNKLFGNAEAEGGAFAGIQATQLTANQWLEFQDPNGAYGSYVADNNGGTVSTPMGGYQIIGSTLRGAMADLGMTGDELMTPQMQDQIAQHIYETQGTGAWEGYNPNGGGRMNDPYVPDIAGLLGEGSVLLPSDLEGITDDLYGDRRTAINDRRSDRDDRQAQLDAILARSDAAIIREDATTERDIRLQGEADTKQAADLLEGMIADISPGDPTGDLSRAIWSMEDITPGVRNAMLSQGQAMLDSRSALMPTAADLPRNDLIEAALSQNMGVQAANSPVTEALTRAGVLGPVGTPLVAGTETADTPENTGAAQTSMLGQLQSVMGEGAVIEDSAGEILTMVDTVYEQFDRAIPKSVIMAMVEDSIKTNENWSLGSLGWEDTLSVEQSRLVENLAPIGTPEAYQQYIEDARAAREGQEDFTKSVSNYEAAALDEAYYASQDTQSAGEQQKAARTRMDAALQSVSDFTQRQAGVEPDAPRLARQRPKDPVAAPITADAVMASVLSGTPTSAAPALTPVYPGSPNANSSVDAALNRVMLQDQVDMVDSWNVMDTPEAQAQPELAAQADAWLKGPQAAQLFQNNPDIVAMAQANPVEFFRQMMGELDQQTPARTAPQPVANPRDRMFINGFRQQ